MVRSENDVQSTAHKVMDTYILEIGSQQHEYRNDKTTYMTPLPFLHNLTHPHSPSQQA